MKEIKLSTKNPFRSLLSKYKDYRDRKFRERIDRAYFHVDEHGNRFVKGHLHAVYDEKTKAKGNVTAWLDTPSDKVVPKVLEFERATGIR